MLLLLWEHFDIFGDFLVVIVALPSLDEAYKVSETAAAAATAASDAIGAAAGAVFGDSEAPSMASMTEAAKAPTTDASESAQPDQ